MVEGHGDTGFVVAAGVRAAAGADAPVGPVPVLPGTEVVAAAVGAGAGPGAVAVGVEGRTVAGAGCGVDDGLCAGVSGPFGTGEEMGTGVDVGCDV